MFMAKLVQNDSVVGLDESSCRMLIPKETPDAKPGDLKTKRLIDKIKEARAEGADSLMGKMWAYRGLDQAPYNIFDFRISRHRDGPDEFFRESRCIVQGDCFSGNTSSSCKATVDLNSPPVGRMRVARFTKYRKGIRIDRSCWI